MGKFKGFIIGLVVFVMLLIGGIYYIIATPISKTNNKGVDFRIGTKADIDFVALNLKKKGLVRSYLVTKYYFQFKNIKLNPGPYEFKQTMSVQEIFNMINSGETDKNIIMVTIPEGYTIRQIAKKLYDVQLINSEESFINETNKGTFNYEFLKGIKDRPFRLEGYLFPDTYEFKKGMSENQIIDIMLKRFNDIYISKIKGKINIENMDVDKIITMASIVEREAKVESERPLVAAVFYNRLKSNMKFESCATIQYILGTPKEVLLYDDLKIESPYNTYKYFGLPVGPICNPGIKSIEAAISPANVDYLFFVVDKTKNDGSHFFTKDYKEFLKYKSKL